MNIEEIKELIEKKQFTKLKEELKEMKSADISTILDELDKEQAVIIFRLLSKEKAGMTFSYMETDMREKLIKDLTDTELKNVLDELFMDDTVDLIEEMPSNVVTRILRNVDKNDRKVINELLKYPEDSAGSIMTTEFIDLKENMTIEQALDRIRQIGTDSETIYTCYVLDQNRKLQGIISIKELILAKEESLIADNMETNIRQDNNEEVEIDIMQIIRMLLSKIWIVIVAGVATAIVAFGITEIAITPQYQSSIKLYIINRQNGTTTTLSDIQSSTQLVKDYKVLVTSLPVVEQVVKQLDLDISPDALVGKISCEIETDSRVLQVTVTDTDPQRAKEIVDAIADVSAKQITSVMQIEGVNVIEYGRVANAPSSPNVKKNTMLGAIAGIVIAIAVLVVNFILDDRIKTSDDVEKYLGITNLSLIPLTEEEYNGQPSSKKKKTRK